MPITLAQRPVLSQGDVDVGSVDFTDYLDAGESLTGTPTVVEITTAHLTLANKQLNSAAIVVNGRSVAANKAVQFKVSGQQAGNTYTIQVTVSTNASVARTVTRYVKFNTE